MRWQQRLNAFLKRLRQILQDEDLHYRFLALFLAIILWFFAGGHGRLLTNERAVTLQPEVIGLPADYALLGQPGPVRIVIRGTNTAISRVEETARAVVDLSSAIEGEGTYAVEVSLPKGAELVSVTPRWVNITTERMLANDYAVYVGLLGLPTDYSVENYTVEPETVTVRGPRSRIERVATAAAYVNLGSQTQFLEGSFPVRAVDAAGRDIDGVTVEPEYVFVTVKLAEQRTKRTLPVVPRFNGELADGLAIAEVRLIPDSVTVSIPVHFVNQIQVVETQLINLTGLTAGEYNMNMGLNLPGGVQVEGSGTVQIILVIRAAVPESEPEPEPELDPEPDMDQPLLPVPPESEQPNQDELEQQEPLLPIEPPNSK
ncbi:MAG: YbbR-like domain-containing protein [Candidatus Wallacebacter cryptica]|jgi:YbbR domain-containing protein